MTKTKKTVKSKGKKKWENVFKNVFTFNTAALLSSKNKSTEKESKENNEITQDQK